MSLANPRFVSRRAGSLRCSPLLCLLVCRAMSSSNFFQCFKVVLSKILRILVLFLFWIAWIIGKVVVIGSLGAKGRGLCLALFPSVLGVPHGLLDPSEPGDGGNLFSVFVLLLKMSLTDILLPLRVVDSVVLQHLPWGVVFPAAPSAEG